MLQEEVLTDRTTLLCRCYLLTATANRKTLGLILWYHGFFPGGMDGLNTKVTARFYIAVNTMNLWIPISLPLASSCCGV